MFRFQVFLCIVVGSSMEQLFVEAELLAASVLRSHLRLPNCDAHCCKSKATQWPDAERALLI